jgi:hypothetical protein
MFRKLTLLAVLGFFCLTIPPEASAQISNEQLQRYLNDAKGNAQFKKKGIMDGNLVRTMYFNQGEVARWPDQPSGEWPKGTGHSYLDGVAVLVGAEFRAANGDIIHSVETAYREWMDQDPVTGELWGFEPLPGYGNPGSQIPALSNNPDTWPTNWPAALMLTPEWDGFWFGYFGRGVLNADLETFFVMDDSRDKEWARPPFNFFPVASDHDRGGLGLRVEVRAFQWSHVLAEDNIFWHYDIVNLADNTYDKTVFGFYTDIGAGGTWDSADDNAYYDTQLDLAYGYDDNGFGSPGNWGPVGYMGYAFLESPGNKSNGIDDDEDGIIDESRDGDAGEWIFGPVGYYNEDGSLDRDGGIKQRWHWSGDEDGDWVGFSDLNGDGLWDPETEPLNNDVGRDGVGPLDLQYTGPDEGEGDGRPTNGEPNFNATDHNESDQIGLTSLAIYRLVEGGGGDGWPRHDEGIWNRMTYQNFDTELQRANISMVFGSGPFPLLRQHRERYSMALLFGSDLTDLIFNKETVQQIYDADYNFAKPPLTPRLTAVPGDKKVILYWDTRAEKSRDPFLAYKEDFEGYLIYRSTEPEFQDIKVITDSRGEPRYWKPIAQFDLIDGIRGPDPVGINGAHFWRGSDSGLQHTFIDSNVVNGQRYYYALVAYDQGDPNLGTRGLQPSETTKIIREDFSGVIQFVDINCAVVTPNAAAAGYVPPEIQGSTSRPTAGIGSGSINVQVLAPGEIQENVTYKVLFHSTGAAHNYKTISYDIIDVTHGVTLESNIDARQFGADIFSPPVAGFAVSIQNDTSVTVDLANTGWLSGSSNLDFRVYPSIKSRAITTVWPADYEIRFFEDFVDTTNNFRIPIKFVVWNLSDDRRAEVEVWDNDRSRTLSLGDEFTIIEFIGANFRLTYDFTYYAPTDPGATPREPQAGDTFVLRTRKPFREGDYFQFSTRAARVENTLAKAELNRIAVVPNPYIGTATWERRTLNQTGRGQRKIDFIHLPQECTIRIYTISGSLVKTIHHQASAADGAESWNLVSDDGMDIAFGYYIFHVDAAGVGQHIGKFAVIK